MTAVLGHSAEFGFVVSCSSTVTRRPKRWAFDGRIRERLQRRLLRCFLEDTASVGFRVGFITVDDDPKDVYEKGDDEHGKWPWRNFRDGYKRLLDRVERDRGRMEADVLAYGHDLAIVKANREEADDAAWHRSPAAKLLKKDVDEKKHKLVKPKQLWLSRTEYKAFDLDCFRKHIYQEVDSRGCFHDVCLPPL